MSWFGRLIDELEERAIKRWRRPSWWNLLIALHFTLGILLSIYEYKAQRAVAARQKTTQGIINAHDPANHNQYGYTFVVLGKSYTGWESPLRTEPTIGQHVLVYYDPADPNTNALTDFQELSENSLGPVPLLIVGIAGVVFLIAFLRRKNAREGK